jgi:hypothetical protein
LQISSSASNIQINGGSSLEVQPPAASEAARKSESGKGKLDESQGRKASGLHDFLGHLPAGLPSKMVKIFDVASPFIC